MRMIHPSLRCPSYEFIEKRVHLGNVTERRGNFTIALYDPAQGKKIYIYRIVALLLLSETPIIPLQANISKGKEKSLV